MQGKREGRGLRIGRVAYHYFTALNAIHNVTNSAWLAWLILFINDLQVLVPFLGAPCAPPPPPPPPPLPASMGVWEGEGERGWKERVGERERVGGREEDRAGIPRRMRMSVWGWGVLGGGEPKVCISFFYHNTHTYRYGGQGPLHAVMQHCV